jgi:LysR family nitrogen assimilation transcriptional regulator
LWDVTIALAVTLARLIAPKILTLAAERCPKVVVKILVIVSTDAIEMIASETVGLAVIPIAAQIPNVEAWPIYRERACLTQLALGKPDLRPIKLQELDGVPLTQSSPNYDLRRRLDDVATSQGIRLDIRYEQDSTDVMTFIALSGFAASSPSFRSTTRSPSAL